MFRYVLVALLVALLLVVVRACTGDIEFGQSLPGSKPLAEYKPVARAIRKADRVVLYEGLPHHLYPDLLKKELQEKQTIEYHGFPFYTDLLDVREDDANRLVELSGNPESVQQMEGVKACGGFHPDYMIEYHVGEEVYRVLVCFGCHEVKVYGPRAELHGDMSDEASETFRAVLVAYHRNRPDWQRLRR
jgi:hypothetical protein